MDIPQLKLLASRVRGLLQQSSCLVGHNQSLDVIAALPGLRNWPEVMAFSDRVAACELDTTSAGRLAYRLKKRFALELTSKDLLAVLAPDHLASSRGALQVWPGGPPPGVYVTTSTRAIGALLEHYEEATDGGLVYAERAGNGWEGSIDLGEYGLWSQGIHRLPSGTLLVVGPIELDQQSWDDAKERLEMACLHALNSGHRVAVLIDTPTPDSICEDILVLVSAAEDNDLEPALAGVVTEDGQLHRRIPFAKAYPQPIPVRTTGADIEALPPSTREALRVELATRKSGIVLFGASRIVEHTAHDQLAAGLALTEHAGPAARIMPRHRGTPAKDWLVPDAIKAIPFLPSIAIAYAQGYRRMLIDPLYSKGEVLEGYADVLFLGATYGHDVANIALHLIARGGRKEAEVMRQIVAVLGVLQVPGKKSEVLASDLFIRGNASDSGTTYEQFEAFLRANRVVRWEDELGALLDSGAVTVAAVKKEERRNHDVLEFLAKRRLQSKAS